MLKCANKGIINWSFCHVLSYTTRFFSGLSWLQGGNQSLLPSQSRKNLRKCRWVTLFQYLLTHTGQDDTHSLGFLMKNHAESEHPLPHNTLRSFSLLQILDTVVQCNCWYLMVLWYCLMILLLSDEWELAGMLHSKTNYQLFPVKPGLPAGICVCWLWFYSTLSLMI